MVQGVSEIAAMCVGLVGLIGAAATTGMPMWKVTAFIEENIIVMETRWEGLWMNCFRQANIRMQCKVYDSLLFLPPDLQAARGLMCCSLALSGLGLLVALAGMRCISCIRDNRRVKTLILMVAGGMQLMASLCVFIPVSWTGHVIIRDFYNPLLLDAQRRELGDALYIGWVTGAVLFASGVMFLCRRMPRDKGHFNVYHPSHLLSYKAAPGGPMSYRPISSVPSVHSVQYHPSLQNNNFIGQQFATPMQNIPPLMTSDGSSINRSLVYNPALPENASLVYQGGTALHPSMQSSTRGGSLYTPGHSLYMSQNTTPYSMTHTGNPSLSYQSSFHAVPHTPVFVGYKTSQIQPQSFSGSSGGAAAAGVYI